MSRPVENLESVLTTKSAGHEAGSRASSSARLGSGELPDNWAAKARRGDASWTAVKPRFFSARRVMFAMGCIFGLCAAGSLAFVNKWREDRIADIERQHNCLRVFLESAEFAEFARMADRNLLATINFIAVAPRAAQAALPQVAQFESEHGELPWTLRVAPLPLSAADEPARVFHAGRAITGLLARRGLRLDDESQTVARRAFLACLSPFVKQFLQRTPGNAFNALPLDRAMQDMAVARFVAHYGTPATIADGDRLFQLCANLSPAIWHAAEQQRKAQTKMAFARTPVTALVGGAAQTAGVRAGQ